MPTPGDRFDELVSVMRRLRSPAGCPWDREQTLATLRPFLLEETYETLDAIDRADWPELREELGDLLFEVVFLAQICEEEGRFSVADALDTVTAKLVRRHPHVFGAGDKLESAEAVLGQWETLKRGERAAAGEPARTTLSGVPRTLPSLLRAYEYGSRAASTGFDWLRAVDVFEKIEEEIAEVRAVVDPPSGSGADPGRVAGRLEEEVGDLLFAIANLARKLGVEPETALRRANDKFADRFTELERRIDAGGRRMKDTPLDLLEDEWQRIKADQRRESPRGADADPD